MKKITLLLILLGINYQAGAEEFVKDGNPCLNDICIGDNMATLMQKKISWVQVKGYSGESYTKYKPNSIAINRVKELVAPQPDSNYKNAIFYLTTPSIIGSSNGGGSFDTRGLEQIIKVQGFCRGLTLEGKFKSKSGYLTTVSMTLVPSDDGASQDFIIRHIIRDFPSNTTVDDKFQVESEFTERYRSVRRAGWHDQRLANAIPAIQDGKNDINPSWRFNGNYLLLASPYSVEDTSQLFLKYPGCNQSLKVD